MITTVYSAINAEREPREGSVGSQLARFMSNRGFVVPDGALPGPLTKFKPELIAQDVSSKNPASVRGSASETDRS